MTTWRRARVGQRSPIPYRHNWHEKNDDELSSLKRVVRDLETSTKRSLQQFEAAVHHPRGTWILSALRLRKRQRR